MPITPLGKSGLFQETLVVREEVDCSSCGHSSYDEGLQPDIIISESSDGAEELSFNKYVACFSAIILLLDGSQQILQVFLPLYFNKHHIPEEQIGFIMGLFAFTIALLSPYSAKLTELLGGRKIAVIISVLLLGSANLLFGLMAYLNERSMVVSISYCSNFMQGLAYTILYTTVYSIGLTLYPREQNMYVAYIGTASALGISIAPAIASVIIPIDGYHWMFFAFGSLICLTTIFIMRVMNDLDLKITASEQRYCDDEEKCCSQGREEKVPDDQPLRASRLLCHRKYTLAVCSLLFMQFSQSAMGPGLALTVKNHRLDIRQIGVFQAIYPVFYVLSLQTVSRVSPLMHKRGIIMTS